MRPASSRLFGALTALVVSVGSSRSAGAQAASVASRGDANDGVYDRFDGDLDLGLGLGAEVGSAGQVAPALRGTAHYFSVAGVYLSGRVHAGRGSLPSLLGAGVDLRPLFVPRWAKGFETGPSLADLTLDSLSLSVGVFWTGRPVARAEPSTGFDAQLGFGVPLFATANGPWLEARGVLRFPDSRAREEALLVTLAWHGFVTTPFSPE